MSKFTELMSKPLQPALGSDDAFTLEGFGCEEGGDICDPSEPFGTDPTTPVTAPDASTPVDQVKANVAKAMTSSDTEMQDPPPLTPEQDQHVDDVMTTVLTPMLLKENMTESEFTEFVNSDEFDTLRDEGFMTERTIVKFDKHARKAQLYEVAIRACAMEHHDPLWRKLETVYKMERILKAKLRIKYHAQASRKVKEYLRKAQKSKSGILSRIASKFFHKK